jgi:hypothetical protein
VFFLGIGNKSSDKLTKEFCIVNCNIITFAMTMISTYHSSGYHYSGSTFSPAPSTGAAPSQGAVLSFASPTRKTYSMFYGTKSATFTPTPYPTETSGTYHLTKPVKITQSEIITKNNMIYKNISKSSRSAQPQIYGNTTSEMSVYQSVNNTVAAWYSPTKGRIIPNSTFCPTCPQAR